ncbi:MAG TPA: ATP-binding protein [Pyrinomonadaceae bacterium]|jgi:signal transduction histidine kinase/ActR/RegA family two-component response regulator|nr:ATP-binding protein [Pyrinomonadaceae bacterium]
MVASLVKAINNDTSVRELIPLGAGDIAVQGGFAPHSDWTHMSESDHFVQFYETDGFLLNSLNGFVGAGLSAGEAVIVVATKEHRAGLEELLKASSLDVFTARATGQYVSLDAGETLSKFMVDGQPEPELCAEIIGSIIKRAAEGRPRVRIFGEMVALLWAEGNCDAAIRLEELWNNLGKIHPFSLFCAYTMNGFNGEEFVERLGNVCAGHSRVIPAESYTSLDSADERLRAITVLQQKARSLEAEVAERKKAEEQLRVSLISEQIARAEAETANRLKDEFLATVSHELRTPLNAIIGWSHMIRSSSLDAATVSRAIETIERNARSQAQLVEDILDVSRVITGKLRLSIEPVDVANVINAAIDSVLLAADSKGIQLEVTLDPSARHVSGDSGRLQQVVWNLLSNAIKFTPSGGRVEVRLERADSNAQIRVSDTGCGISSKFIPFIFDRFRQADGSSTRRHGGLGLGLAIVRHLVELHGGTVSADSRGEGFGSTFTIRLPLAPSLEREKNRRRETKSLLPNEDGNAGISSLPTLDGVQVLLVDDDQDTLHMLAVVLTAYRATVQTATSAAEAMEVLQWYKPDVMVSDLAMPDEDGYSLIGKLRAMDAKSGRQTPAVALTAYVRVEDRVRALSAGFNMFVPKPVEPNELIIAIANLAEVRTAKFVRA